MAKLYIRSSQDLYQLSDVFQYASGDVFNAQQTFYGARPSGDPFGNGSADSNYSDACNQMIQALQNLQNALQLFGTRVNDIGVAYEQIEGGATNAVGH